VWYSAGCAAIAAYARLMLQLDIAGRERVPAGPKLIVANHPSTSDPLYLPLLFREPIDMLLVDSAFCVPLLGSYLRRAGQVRVAHGDGSAFAESSRRLEAGRAVAIFPEGNVSPCHGGMLPPRTGAARLALLTGVPVVPIGIYLPRDRVRRVRASLGRRPLSGHWYLRGPYAMTAGQPLRFSGRGEDAAQITSVTRTITDTLLILARESEWRLKSKTGIALA
jgi:1-acyl-sn-glycerol-3-phosphate acyltransferase